MTTNGSADEDKNCRKLILLVCTAPEFSVSFNERYFWSSSSSSNNSACVCVCAFLQPENDNILVFLAEAFV